MCICEIGSAYSSASSGEGGDSFFLEPFLAHFPLVFALGLAIFWKCVLADVPLTLSCSLAACGLRAFGGPNTCRNSNF